METRREERIGQLLQELNAAISYILKTPPPCLGFRRCDSSRSEQPQCARRFARRLYFLEPRSASHYLLSDQKSRLVKKNAGRQNWLRRW